MVLNWLRKRSSQDVEKGPRGEQRHPPLTVLDIDDNDKFWKLYVDEAVSAAKFKVNIWNTQLEALLLLAGLFAAVVSAFLIDLQTRLRPDPELTALNDLISLVGKLNGETSSGSTGPHSDFPPPTSVQVVGGLWFCSLVITLFGALWGVLSKGWLVQLLRHTPRNPADQALDRWRRDEDVKHWKFEKVIGAVPILIQVGLVLFLAGLVVESFVENEAIGWTLLVLVALGVICYTLVTVLPIFRPHSPFQTPLSDVFTQVPSKIDESATAESMVEILVSKLNDSTNDETFCAAASLLDGQLDGIQYKMWYEGVRKHGSDVPIALWKRLNSFAHRAETTPDRSSLSLSKDASQSDSLRETFVTTSSPVDQGMICLRVILSLLEVGVSGPAARSYSWPIDEDIVRQWTRSTDIFPSTWRFVSLSINIITLLDKGRDYVNDEVVKTDWASMIQGISSDSRLRSIASVTICRGLIRGKENLKHLCALGLATIVELDVTTAFHLPNLKLIQEEDTEQHKKIASRIWTELEQMWNQAATKVLCQEDEWGTENIYHRLLKDDFYRNGVKRSIPTIINRLNNASWSGTRQQAMQILIEVLDLDQFQDEIRVAIPQIVTQMNDLRWSIRQQAIQILAKLSEHSVFQENINDSKLIRKLVGKLTDSDEDVRAQALKTLSIFGTQATLNEKMRSTQVIPEVMKKLTDENDNVREEAWQTMVAFSTNDFYEAEIKAFIPSAVVLLNNDKWETRQQAIQTLTKLSEHRAFQETIKPLHVALEIVKKFQDPDEDVRSAALQATSVFSTDELYEDEIKSFISPIVVLLKDQEWEIRQQAIQTLTKLSNHVAFQSTMETCHVVPKIIATFKDSDRDVRTEAVQAFSTFSSSEFYDNEIKSSLPLIIAQLNDPDWVIRQQAIQILQSLSTHVTSHETFHLVISSLVAKLMDSDPDVRTATIKALSTYNTHDVSRTEEESPINIGIKKLVEQLKDEDTSEDSAQTLKDLSEDASFREQFTDETVLSDILDNLVDDQSLTRDVAKHVLSIVAKRMSDSEMDDKRIILQLVKKLDSKEPNICAAATWALIELDHEEGYSSRINSLIPLIMTQLDHAKWFVRQHALQMLSKQITLDAVEKDERTTSDVLSKLVGKLDDSDEDVRAEALQACRIYGAQPNFQSKLKSMNLIEKVTEALKDEDDSVWTAAIQALLAFSTQEIYRQDFKSSISTTVKGLIGRMKSDTSWSVRWRSVQVLKKLCESAAFRERMTPDIVPELITKLGDDDEDVRSEAIRALPLLGKQNMFQKPMKSEKVISKVAAKVTDSDEEHSVRQAASTSFLDFSCQDFYQSEVKASMPDVIKQLDSEDWVIRQLVIDTMKSLSERASGMFQETIKSDRFLPKLITKLLDKDYDVATSASEAMRAFCKPSNSRTDFLSLLIADLNTIDHLNRMALYKALQKKEPDPTFHAEIYAAICKVLNLMKDKDLSFICDSITILKEIMDAELIEKDALPEATSKSTRDAVEKAVKTHLIYNKTSADRGDVVQALARLVNFDVFLDNVKPAIGGLIEAISDNDRNVSSVAIAAISDLAAQDPLRKDLTPAVPKLIQRLNGGDEDEQRPTHVIKALFNLARYKEFQTKLRRLAPILTKILEDKSGTRREAVKRGEDKKEVTFHKSACDIIYQLCEQGTVGTDLTAKLAPVLSNMDASIAEDLLKIIDKLIEKGSLTISDYIALASALRIVSPMSVEMEVQVYKLEIASALARGFHADHPDEEYGTFFTTIVGDSTDTVKSKTLAILKDEET